MPRKDGGFISSEFVVESGIFRLFGSLPTWSEFMALTFLVFSRQRVEAACFIADELNSKINYATCLAYC